MCLFYSFKYNFLDEISDVDPSSLKPAERLEWNLSPDSVRDIDEAKHTIDKCVFVVSVCLSYVCVVFVCLSVCLSYEVGERFLQFLLTMQFRYTCEVDKLQWVI